MSILKGRTGVSDCDNSSFAAYLRVALPSAVLMWAEWWAYEAMSLLAGLCGKTGLAAHTAACSVLLIVFQLPTGLGNATSAMVGHAIGAGSSTDAKSSLKVAVMLILSTCLLVAVILIPSRFFIARLYTSDPDVLSTLELLCVILGLFQLFDGLQTVLESGLIGLGMQKVLSLPLASGVVGIWVAGVVGMMVTVALYLCLLRRCNFEYLASSVQRELMSA
ncbi:Multidrug and toxin extrusion protein 2 (MATE-2) (mMATE-2) (H(+)/organic cation antiporter kidney-specific) (Solute carrier family 47 member 2) [Durusdinium trenchii]|uniref:Multidrug and toxin extrusion protein 2 (MATE-2) (MMATE-2) (H(+)/organic cation antiporter kidney-specific) (Solute carrier family 47 member 2) n=1 Tax=Durusdinium trenchii TaxID=1381693 RepID=A0ABP0QVX2_9DINO